MRRRVFCRRLLRGLLLATTAEWTKLFLSANIYFFRQLGDQVDYLRNRVNYKLLYIEQFSYF